MTIYVNQQEAEQNFSQLFSQVLQGEEIVLSVEGQEKARLIPSSFSQNNTSSKVSEMRIPGIDQGRFFVPNDFDAPLPADLLKSFESET